MPTHAEKAAKYLNAKPGASVAKPVIILARNAMDFSPTVRLTPFKYSPQFAKNRLLLLGFN